MPQRRQTGCPALRGRPNLQLAGATPSTHYPWVPTCTNAESSSRHTHLPVVQLSCGACSCPPGWARCYSRCWCIRSVGAAAGMRPRNCTSQHTTPPSTVLALHASSLPRVTEAAAMPPHPCFQALRSSSPTSPRFSQTTLPACALANHWTARCMHRGRSRLPARTHTQTLWCAAGRVAPQLLGGAMSGWQRTLCC